jgi:carbamoyl-phosphate synthase large subunit
MGGSGGGIAYNKEEFIEICERGLDLSPTNELLVEESILGWKEFEMEVVRDTKDNCIIICSIENLTQWVFTQAIRLRWHLHKH